MKEGPSPVVALMQRLQTSFKTCLDTVKSLEIFAEINIYPIVVGYMLVEDCGLSTKVDCAFVEGGRRTIIDRMVNQPVNMPNLGTNAIRFCFFTVPTFKLLGGFLDIGISAHAVPPPKPVHESECDFMSVYARKNQPYAVLDNYHERTQIVHKANTKCPIQNRLVYIDFELHPDDVLTTTVAHARSKTCTNLRFMTCSIRINKARFPANAPLYPLLSSLIPLDVSVHSM